MGLLLLTMVRKLSLCDPEKNIQQSADSIKKSVDYLA